MVGRPEILDSVPELATDWSTIARVFPVRVPRTLWPDASVDPRYDPLARQVLPSAEELQTAPDDLADPVGDARCAPLPWVVQKYPDRVLLLMTKRCLVYCRYCFRRTHNPEHSLDPSPQAWQAALDYVRRVQPAEVILSGGDPLALPDAKIFDAIDAIRQHHDPVIRIHTRAPLAQPARISAGLVAGLRARRPLWLVVHLNHPRELSPSVRDALVRLIDAGLPVLNQSVLLRGVNDDPELLAELCRALVRLGVFPYYLHHPDHVVGNAHFRVSIPEGLALYASLKAKLSGLALPRYVIDPPDGSGKVDVARWWSTASASAD